MSALSVPECECTLPQLPLEPDLFGKVLRDHYEGHAGFYFLRRSDNFVDRDTPARYFHTWDQMPPHHRCLLSHARGRVLDIGAGAGQHALALQERGCEVTAIDTSPMAAEVCRARGVRNARVMDARALELEPNSFDTVLLMNNNIGIPGSPERLRGLLRTLHGLMRQGGQILADVVDYTATRDSLHLRYQQWNRLHGRYPGSVRLRVEYQGQCGPEFDWLLITLPDLRAICGETGWRVARCVQVDAAVGLYAVGIFKE